MIIWRRDPTIRLTQQSWSANWMIRIRAVFTAVETLRSHQRSGYVEVIAKQLSERILSNCEGMLFRVLV